MEASRRQPAPLEGLSRFLVSHERCRSGFDVAHPDGPGGGTVSIVCRGCGARHRYATASIEIERELRIERMPPPRWQPPAAEPPPPPRLTSAPPSRTSAPKPSRTAAPRARQAAEGASAIGSPGPAPAPSRGRRSAGARRRRRDRATIVVLAVAAAALAVAAIRLGGGEGSEPAARSTPPRTGLPAPASSDPLRPRPTPTVGTARYTAPLPRQWTRRRVAGGLLLEPAGAGSGVRVQIFSRPRPQLSRREMVRLTSSILQGRNRGAAISPAHPFAAPRGAAFKLSAHGRGASETALAILRGRQRYLLIRTVGTGASAGRRLQALRIERGFEPR